MGRVLIGTGRDASDVAFNTVFGGFEMPRMKVWADQTELSELPPVADGYPVTPTAEGLALSAAWMDRA